MSARNGARRQPDLARFQPAFDDGLRACILATFRDAPLSRGGLRRPFDPTGVLLNFCARHWPAPFRRRPPSGAKALFRWTAATLGKAVLWFHVGFILTTCVLLTIFRTVNPGATWLMLDRKAAMGWKIEKPRYVSLYAIPKLTRTMTIRLEDGTFFSHHGFELSAFRHAYELNRQFGEPVYGGSTITMQTARTIFLTPAKSYVRKYLELIIALEMEALLGKERILELYFNYAEWGKGVFGIDTAARFHYRTGVAKLDLDQSMRLVTLLSSPIKYRPYTLQRSNILKTRYAYLVSRFGPRPEPEPAETSIDEPPRPLPEPGSPEGGGDAAASDAATTAAGSPGSDSPQAGTDGASASSE